MWWWLFLGGPRWRGVDGLLAWYDGHRRELPWRGDSDPYRVLVSEIMLQQTRVATVLARYGPWLERFPTVHALAAASEEAVMAAWSGLGYYRRARALHAAARYVAAHGWPPDAAALQALSGVGAYTAAAVASISFGEAVPAIDGNALRVLSRVADIPLDVTTAAGRRAVDAVARRAMAADRPGDWNQAVMDLGATVCTPTPRCDDCPLACLARQRGTAAARPVRPARRAAQREDAAFAYLQHRQRVLLVRRPAGLLAGTWSLPGGPGAVAELEALVRQQTGLEARLDSTSAASLQHVFTHRVWQATVMRGVATAPAEPHSDARWFALEGLDEVGLSTFARRAIAAAQRM